MRLEFHPEAERELIEAAVYYESRVPGLGVRFEAEVLRAATLLLDQPAAGRAVDLAFREFSLRRFPFNLVYSVGSDHLRVEAVAHHSRRPGYWRGRGGD